MSGAPNDHFSAIADAYARGRFGYPPELFDFLSGHCHDHTLAWDCATGSGQCVPELARRFHRVVATDISGDLLSRAPPVANVTYAVAPAEHSPLSDQSVDLITVAQAVHWFKLDDFWAEVRRVIKPGGVLAFWAYTWPAVDSFVDARFAPLREMIAPYWPNGIERVHQEYRTIDAPFAPVPAPPFAISVRWPRARYLAHIGSWSAVRYLRERTGTDPLPVFDADLARVWPDGEDKTVRWTIHLRVNRC